MFLLKRTFFFLHFNFFFSFSASRRKPKEQKDVFRQERSRYTYRLAFLFFFFPSLRSFYRLRDKSLKFRRETADTNSVLDFSMRKTSNTCNIYAHKNESKFPSLRTQSHIFFFFIFLCYCFHAETIVGQIILCYVYQFFFYLLRQTLPPCPTKGTLVYNAQIE